LNLEQLGYFGIFLAGATPWFEAIGVVPAGNIITIAVFAYSGANIRAWRARTPRGKGQAA
jgi:hypothetical protein